MQPVTNTCKPPFTTPVSKMVHTSLFTNRAVLCFRNSMLSSILPLQAQNNGCISPSVLFIHAKYEQWEKQKYIIKLMEERRKKMLLQ